MAGDASQRPARTRPPIEGSAGGRALHGAASATLAPGHEGARSSSQDRGGESQGAQPTWERAFEAFFSADPQEAGPAAALFARMVRFWIKRLGVRDHEVSSDDLVQDVLLELTRARAHIVEPRALGAWLRTTTLRKVQDRWRATQRAPDCGHPERLESIPARTLLPEESVLRKQDHADLLAAIEHLPPLLRQCVQLQLRGFSETEIARRLDTNPTDGATVQRHSVKNWLRKARTLLRSALLETRS